MSIEKILLTAWARRSPLRVNWEECIWLLFTIQNLPQWITVTSFDFSNCCSQKIGLPTGWKWLASTDIQARRASDLGFPPQTQCANGITDPFPLVLEDFGRWKCWHVVKRNFNVLMHNTESNLERLWCFWKS